MNNNKKIKRKKTLVDNFLWTLGAYPAEEMGSIFPLDYISKRCLPSTSERHYDLCGLWMWLK
jgi:hypothetical protein